MNNSNLFELLAKLGLPSAFVGMVLIAVIFKSTHRRVSAWAAVVAVCLVGVYGVIQLAEALSGRDIDITVSPTDAHAFTASGPVALEISVSRGSSILKTARIDQPSKANFEDRLRNLGWRPSAECTVPADGTPAFWSTNRIYAGQTQRLGLTEYGLLRINAKQFTGTGETVVALELADRGQPVPQQVAIRNKGLEVQSFSDAADFFIAVREADFTADPAWAAFVVFRMR